MTIKLTIHDDFISLFLVTHLRQPRQHYRMPNC